MPALIDLNPSAITAPPRVNPGTARRWIHESETMSAGIIPNFIDGDSCADVPDLIRDLDGARAPCPSRPRLGGRGMG